MHLQYVCCNVKGEENGPNRYGTLMESHWLGCPGWDLLVNILPGCTKVSTDKSQWLLLACIQALGSEGSSCRCILLQRQNAGRSDTDVLAIGMKIAASRDRVKYVPKTSLSGQILGFRV